MSNSVGRIDNFRAKARKLSILPTEFDIFDIRQHCTYSIYLLMSDLLSSVISNTEKHRVSSTRISDCNDVMNHVNCVIKRDVYTQKMH